MFRVSNLRYRVELRHVAVGTYLPVAGANSPHTVNPVGTPAKFDRVQVSP